MVGLPSSKVYAPASVWIAHTALVLYISIPVTAQQLPLGTSKPVYGSQLQAGVDVCEP